MYVCMYVHSMLRTPIRLQSPESSDGMGASAYSSSMQQQSGPDAGAHHSREKEEEKEKRELWPLLYYPEPGKYNFHL